MDYIIRPDPNLKPLSPEEVEEGRKLAELALGFNSHELTPQEKLELAKEMDASAKVFKEDTRRRRGVSVPFPLEDIYYSTDDTEPADGVYKHNDPEYLERRSGQALGAIGVYRTFFYRPGYYLNKGQLKKATEVALDIRAECNELSNIPLATNPDCPTDEDFIRLGQWFLDAHTAIAKANAATNDTKITIADPITQKDAATLAEVAEPTVFRAIKRGSITSNGLEGKAKRVSKASVILWKHNREAKKMAADTSEDAREVVEETKKLREIARGIPDKH